MVGTGLKESLTGLRSTCLNRNMHVLDAGKISDHANAEVQGMSNKSIHVNEQELQFLFKLLLNMDYQDEVRTSLFVKVEKEYFDSKYIGEGLGDA